MKISEKMNNRNHRFRAEDHAILFSAMTRNAVLYAGEAGREAIEKGVQQYALERGKRIRKRAIKDGNPLTMSVYRAYNEWEASPGTLVKETIQRSPYHISHNPKCPWYTTWKELDMLEEGFSYCKYIDAYLLKGFNENLKLGVTQVRSDGVSDYCEFKWYGIDLTEENEKMISDLRDRVKDYAVKDWEYHVGHLYSSLAQSLRKELYENIASSIISRTYEQFVDMYGKHAKDVFRNSYSIDYTSI